VYEDFFGLSDSPFRLTPDPHFLYLSPKHAEALAHLRLGLNEPGGFVCITGEIGTGKTTVLRTFLTDLGPEVATAYVFNPTLSWGDLLHRIARELGAPIGTTTGGDLMDALNAHLLAERKQGRIAVVVIDEAQALPLEVLERLRLLSNLETSTEKLLRLVLVGQPELARLLLDPALAQLNQRITLRWHLRALTRAETFAYVRHRLRVAGGDEAVRLFTVPALFLVHRYSGGVPRLVNMIAHRATLAAFVRKRRRVSASAVRQAYREIKTVPLATVSRGHRLGWAAGALAVAAGVVSVGMPKLEWPTGVPALVARVPVSVPPPAAPAPPAVTEPRADATAPPPAADALETRLAQLAPERSLRSAVETVLATWGAEALDAEERLDPASLEPIAHRRGLENLRLTGNLSMLRLLDLPAVLELRMPETRETIHVALVGIDDGGATLALGAERVRVTPAELDRVWFGDAHVLWRDFEWLGPTFGTEARGPNVGRLQRLLTRANVYAGEASGVFDDPTQAAVLQFQRSRRLDPDCRVGRLTRITLYGTVGGYRMPTLAGADGRSPATADAETARGAS
jgi:general secretion pathway protein A